eukprot:8321669-Pyramimonas_sp.AAC.1
MCWIYFVARAGPPCIRGTAAARPRPRDARRKGVRWPPGAAAASSPEAAAAAIGSRARLHRGD